MELIVTVLVMGTAIVAILGAVLTMIRTSDLHRRSVRASNEAMSVAERIDGETYLSCTLNPTYYPPTGYTAPANATITVTRKDLVSRTVDTPEFTGSGTACSGPDQGAQEITVNVKYGTGQRAVQESVVLVKRKQ